MDPLAGMLGVTWFQYIPVNHSDIDLRCSSMFASRLLLHWSRFDESTLVPPPIEGLIVYRETNCEQSSSYRHLFAGSRPWSTMVWS